MIIAFNWISIQIDQTVVIDQPLRPASGPFPHMAVARGEHDKSKGEFQKKNDKSKGAEKQTGLPKQQRRGSQVQRRHDGFL